MSQADKIALVTGGAQGIGRAFCESLLEHGAKVAVCDLKKETGESTLAELKKKYGERVIFLQCDVTNPEQFEDCFKATKDAFGELNLLINNAGIANETSTWHLAVDVNLVALIRGTQLGFKYMGKNSGGKGGTIVNIASITSLEPFPSIPVYSATKAAVNQLSRSYGHDVYYLKTGVKVVAVNPGMTDTPLIHAGPKLVGDDPDVIDNFVKHLGTFYYQNAKNMGKGLIEVLEKAQNGSLWTIENDEPAKLTILK